ncbi:MAG: hypothetical protein AB7O78_19720 [Thermoleophilia bacterium]
MIEGVANSPFPLGTLQLDRTPPRASAVVLTPAGGVVTADWIQSDALSGTDPGADLVAEVNTSPAGDGAGSWVPFAEQPAPGDGRRIARTSLAGLPDGRHLVRVRARDRAGNVAAQSLGTVTADGTAPVVTDVRVTIPARAGGQAVAELAFRADDGGGVGVGAVSAGPAADPGTTWSVGGASGPDRVMVALPGPGVHAVTVRVADALGNRGVSAPVAVRVPTAAEAADGRVPAAPAIAARGGDRQGPAVTWAWREVRQFHARRGVRVDARLRVARTPAAWRRLLTGVEASRYRGYATLGGDVLLGPAAVRGLEALGAGRERGRGTRPSRADLDGAAAALAVLLHETLHASGPAAREDALGTRSGRAFEEGMTEAATADLMRPFAAGLRLEAGLRARLVAAVGRRPVAYPAATAWARRMSARATGAAAGSRKARAWRIRVADTWGADRWERLAAATGLDESALRAGAQAAGGSGGPAGAVQTTTISVPGSMEETSRPAAGTMRATSSGV